MANPCGMCAKGEGHPVKKSKKLVILHKILQLPLFKCVDYLAKGGGGDQVFSSLCPSCSLLMDRGVSVCGRIDRLTSVLHEIQVMALDLLLADDHSDSASLSQRERQDLIQEVKWNSNWADLMNFQEQSDNKIEQNFDEFVVPVPSTCSTSRVDLSFNFKTTGWIDLESPCSPPFLEADPLDLGDMEAAEIQNLDEDTQDKRMDANEEGVEEEGSIIDVPVPGYFNMYSDTEEEEEEHKGDDDEEEERGRKRLKLSHESDPSSRLGQEEEDTLLSFSSSLQDQDDDQSTFSPSTSSSSDYFSVSVLQKSKKSNPLKRKRVEGNPSFVYRTCACLLCPATFKSNFMLGKHYKVVHNDPQSWPCSQCGSVFEQQRRLYEHRKNVHKNLAINKVKPQKRIVPSHPRKHANYVCVVCDEVFKHSAPLSSHYNEVHGHLTTWPCKECGEEQETRKKLYRHRRNVHRNVPVNKTMKPRRKNNYVCVVCDATFTNSGPMSHHYAEVHGDLTTWPCRECGEELETQRKLYLHRLEVHKNLPINSSHGLTAATPKRAKGRTFNRKKKNMLFRYYSCVICDEECSNTITLGRHYASVHGHLTAWPCGEVGCGQEFESRDKLYWHRKDVHKNLPVNQRNSVEHKTGAADNRFYSCVVCDAELANCPDLGAHYKSVHGHLISWPCGEVECGQEFESKDLLYFHRKNVHKNLPVNRFQAEEREIKVEMVEIHQHPSHVTEKAKVTTEMVTESKGGDAKYPCLVCDTVFYNANPLTKHYARAHGDLAVWPCRECGEEWKTRKELYRHRDEHRKSGRGTTIGSKNFFKESIKSK